MYKIVMDNAQSFYCDAKYQQGQNIMKKMIRIIPLLAMCFLTFLTSTIKAEGGNSNDYLQSVITAIDYHLLVKQVPLKVACLVYQALLHLQVQALPCVCPNQYY